MDASKITGYYVLGPPADANVYSTKFTGYLVVGKDTTNNKVEVSTLKGYLVIYPIPPRPQLFIT